MCYRCGRFCIEFFPNVLQENLPVEMASALVAMGSGEVSADNTSPASRATAPLTKCKAGRQVRPARDNFLAGRGFTDFTAPDGDAALLCAGQAGRRRCAVACVPTEEHESACRAAARELVADEEVARWPAPRRRTSFEGFAGRECRKFDVSLWVEQRD